MARTGGAGPCGSGHLRQQAERLLCGLGGESPYIPLQHAHSGKGLRVARPLYRRQRRAFKRVSAPQDVHSCWQRGRGGERFVHHIPQVPRGQLADEQVSMGARAVRHRLVRDGQQAELAAVALWAEQAICGRGRGRRSGTGDNVGECPFELWDAKFGNRLPFSRCGGGRVGGVAQLPLPHAHYPSDHHRASELEGARAAAQQQLYLRARHRRQARRTVAARIHGAPTRRVARLQLQKLEVRPRQGRLI
mmetsp:Transcript_2886/g.7010  ORF Transcript_2886/g.7010 Transcript_2886/m.7010 type:complete len:248 (+) Transcript_2886:739-1482(+)